MHGQRRLRLLHGGDLGLHRLLHLLEGAHLDLADALARHAELGGEVLQRHRVVGEPAGLEDATLARIEHAHRAVQRVAAVISECTATISREVAGLKAMVDEFSRFARLPDTRLESANLNEVITQAAGLYKERLDGVSINTDLDADLPAARANLAAVMAAVGKTP